MKKYLISIQNRRGGVLSIGYYADTPDKNYRLYYCGSDTGLRFARIGNAARALEKEARTWEQYNLGVMRYYTNDENEIPRRGSNA